MGFWSFVKVCFQQVVAKVVNVIRQTIETPAIAMATAVQQTPAAAVGGLLGAAVGGLMPVIGGSHIGATIGSVLGAFVDSVREDGHCG